MEQEGKPLYGHERLVKLRLNWSEIKLLSRKCSKTCSQEILKKKFPDVFSNDIRHVKGIKAKLKLKRDSQPKFMKARTVPFAMKEMISLVKKGVVTPVNHSKWAKPIVPIPKSNAGVRFCGDFKVTLNPCLEVDQYPLPNIEHNFQILEEGNNS